MADPAASVTASRGDARSRAGSVAPIGLGWLAGAVRAMLAHPTLWPVAVVQLRRLAAPGWWRRRPFLPLPDAGYLAFRLETMYGGEAPHPPEPADLVTYLRWCRGANGR